MLAVESQTDAVFQQVPIDRIVPNPHQPRTVFDETALQELADSVAEVGVLQPVVVRPLPGDTYELVMGERRWRAATAAGLTHVPALVRETADANMLRDALIENVHRANLNLLEEAASYQQLIQDTGATQAEVAMLVRKDRSHVSRALKLLSMTPYVQGKIASGVLLMGHAEVLTSIPDPLVAEDLARRIVEQGLSVQAARELRTNGILHGAEVLDGRAEAWKDKQRAKKFSAPVSERAQLAAEALGDALDTRVRVEMAKKSRGRIVVEFAGDDDFDRLVRLLAKAAGAL